MLLIYFLSSEKCGDVINPETQITFCTRYRQKTKKAKNTTHKTKRTGNTNPTKNGGGRRGGG